MFRDLFLLKIILVILESDLFIVVNGPSDGLDSVDHFFVFCIDVLRYQNLGLKGIPLGWARHVHQLPDQLIASFDGDKLRRGNRIDQQLQLSSAPFPLHKAIRGRYSVSLFNFDLIP